MGVRGSVASLQSSGQEDQGAYHGAQYAHPVAVVGERDGVGALVVWDRSLVHTPLVFLVPMR